MAMMTGVQVNLWAIYRAARDADAVYEARFIAGAAGYYPNSLLRLEAAKDEVAFLLQ